MKELAGFVLFLAVVFFVGYKFGMPQYKYRMFKGDMQDVSDYVARSPEEAFNNAAKTIKEHGLPIPEEEYGSYIYMEIVPGSLNYKYDIEWDDTVDFWGYYKKTYHFVVHSEPRG